MIDSYIFSIWYKVIYFSLPLNPAYTEWSMCQIFCVPDVKNKNSLNPVLYFIANFPKLLWDFFSELINLKYAFNIPFKITLKTIIIGTFFQFHDGVQLNILPTLSSKILLLNSRFGSSSAIMDFATHNLPGGQVELWAINKHLDFTLKNGSFVKARI